MLKKLKPKSEFNRNVLTLMTGTSIAQAIPLAISPILTRIFTPADFGIFALYISIAGTIASISTGRYELAMMLPKKDSDAYHIVILSLLISSFISLICLVIVFFFNTEIASMLRNESIANWLYFIPLTIMLSSAYQSLYYWNNRSKRYTKLSKSKIIQTSTTVSTNLTLGYLFLGPVGLVLGNIFGQLLSTLYFLRNFYNNRLRFSFSFSQVYKLARRYKKFPQYDVFSTLFSMGASHSVHVFFNVFFGAVSSGYYYLVQKIFGLPLMLIAASVQDVFKEKVTAIHNENGDTRSFFIQTFLKLAKLSILPTIFIYLFAIDLFGFFFGQQWQVAGEYVQILTPVFFIRFISFPLSFMFYVSEKQHINIIGQFVLFVLVVSVMFIGREHDAVYTVKLLSIVSSAFYLVYLYLSFIFTSKGKNN